MTTPRPALTFPSKLTGENRVYTFDLTNEVPAGITIQAATWTATVFRGADATPANVISGVADISGDPLVSHMLAAGVNGVVYTITCTYTLSNQEVRQERALLLVSDVVVAA